MPNANLTEAWLKKHAADPARGTPPVFTSPELAQERWWHTNLPGFGVVIGKRFATFVVQHRNKLTGRQEMQAIGRWGHAGAGEDGADVWTVERAYKRALVLLGQMEAGIETRSHKRADGVTLRQAFEAHKAKLATKLKAGKRSQATIDTISKTMARKEVVPLLDRPFAEITGDVLADLHAEIKANVKKRKGAANEKGAPVANRVIANISAAWNTMNQKLHGKLGHWNPTKSVDKDELLKGTRGRVNDLADWYKRVQTMNDPIRQDGLVFALYTGLRHEDVRTIRFDEIDEDKRTLRRPDPKGGTNAAFTLPLPATLLEIVRRRRQDNAKDLGAGEGETDGGWLFPGRDEDGEIGPIADLRKQVTDEKGNKTRFPAEQVHDLRRTYESEAHEAGVSKLDQKVLTNHSIGGRDVHDAYIAQHIDHLARCQAKIEARIKTAIDGTPAVVKPARRSAGSRRARAASYRIARAASYRFARF